MPNMIDMQHEHEHVKSPWGLIPALLEKGFDILRSVSLVRDLLLSGMRVESKQMHGHMYTRSLVPILVCTYIGADCARFRTDACMHPPKEFEKCKQAKQKETTPGSVQLKSKTLNQNKS